MEVAVGGGGSIYFSHGMNNARGVAICIKKGLQYEFLSKYTVVQGKAMVLEILLNECKLLLINVYAPNEDDPAFFQCIFNQVEALDYDHLIIGGDFNKVLDMDMDKKSKCKNMVVPKAVDFLNAYIEENLWVEAWHQLNPDKCQFTWFHRNPHVVMSRIDYFLMPFSTFGHVDSCDIIPDVHTDHSFVRMEISLHREARGRGLWKMNISLLQNIDYINEINNIISQRFGGEDIVNIKSIWELFKIEVAEFSMKFSKQLAQDRKNKVTWLQTILKDMLDKFSKLNLNSPTMVSQIEEWNVVIDTIKIELEKESLVAVRGALIRSRVQWANEGEKCIKYFLNLERSHSQQKDNVSGRDCIRCNKGSEAYSKGTSTIFSETV